MLKRLLLNTAGVYRFIQESEYKYEQVTNTARTWNPKNRSRSRRGESLLGTEKMRNDTAVLWCAQVDAAAQDEAEVDGGGGAPRLATRGRRRRRDEGKRKEMTIRSYL